MYDSPADIERAFSALDYIVPPAIIERLVGAVEPVISFSTSDVTTPGATRFGGAPDMAPGAVWPRLPKPAVFGPIAEPYKNYDIAGARERLETEFPYAFIGQVNLAELPADAPGVGLLPDEGRLLFFFDLESYDIGIWTAKVVWDNSPIDTLQPVPFPEDLLAAHRDGYREVTKNDEFDAQLARDFDHEIIDPKTLPETSQFIFPMRGANPRLQYVLPAQGTLEFDQIGIETFEYDSEEFWLSDVIGDLEHQLWSDRDAGLYNSWMGGPPSPEQDDPRLHVSDFLGGEVGDWMLLLQVDVPSLMQRNGEGTLYFVIRKDDLRKRNFDHVVGLYQQT